MIIFYGFMVVIALILLIKSSYDVIILTEKLQYYEDKEDRMGQVLMLTMINKESLEQFIWIGILIMNAVGLVWQLSLQ